MIFKLESPPQQTPTVFLVPGVLYKTFQFILQMILKPKLKFKKQGTEVYGMLLICHLRICLYIYFFYICIEPLRNYTRKW